MQAGYVYIINAIGTNYYKVGIADDAVRRLRQLQTGCPHQLRIVGLYWSAEPLRIEQKVFELFSGHKVRGEWLELENETRIFRVLEALTCNLVERNPVVLKAEIAPSARYAEAKKIAAMPHASWLIKLIMIIWSIFLPTNHVLVEQERTEAEKLIEDELKAFSWHEDAAQRPPSQDELEFQRFWEGNNEQAYYSNREQGG